MKTANRIIKFMRVFVFAYDAAYDLGAAIVYAPDEETAIKMAKECKYIWDTTNFIEIKKENNPKIIIVDNDMFLTVD